MRDFAKSMIQIAALALTLAVSPATSYSAENCDCPRYRYMQIPAGGQTYWYYMAYRFLPCPTPVTTVGMYSSNGSLNVLSNCCVDDCVPFGGAFAPSPVAVGGETRPDSIGIKVKPLEMENLQPNYDHKAVFDDGRVKGLGNFGSFYFQLEGTKNTVWMQAFVRQVRHTPFDDKEVLSVIANALQINGDEPPDGPNKLEGVFKGTPIEIEGVAVDYAYTVKVGEWDVIAITTAGPAKP